MVASATNWRYVRSPARRTRNAASAAETPVSNATAEYERASSGTLRSSHSCAAWRRTPSNRSSASDLRPPRSSKNPSSRRCSPRSCRTAASRSISSRAAPTRSCSRAVSRCPTARVARCTATPRAAPPRAPTGPPMRPSAPPASAPARSAPASASSRASLPSPRWRSAVSSVTLRSVRAKQSRSGHARLGVRTRAAESGGDQFRLSRARRSAAWSRGVSDSAFALPHRGDHDGDRMGLGARSGHVPHSEIR
jgi:hypothetical protein